MHSERESVVYRFIRTLYSEMSSIPRLLIFTFILAESPFRTFCLSDQTESIARSYLCRATEFMDPGVPPDSACDNDQFTAEPEDCSGLCLSIERPLSIPHSLV